MPERGAQHLHRRGAFGDRQLQRAVGGRHIPGGRGNSASSSDRPARSPTQVIAASRSTRLPGPTYSASFSSSARVDARSAPSCRDSQDSASGSTPAPLGAQRFADRLLQRAAFLGVAADRRAVGRGLQRRPQLRARRDRRPLQHHQRRRLAPSTRPARVRPPHRSRRAPAPRAGRRSVAAPLLRPAGA